MSEHSAIVEWHAAEAFRQGRFSRVHEWQFDGGLKIAASSSPAIVPAPYSDPAAIDPEEAFIAAVASCHMMSFLFVANRAGIAVLSYRDEAVGALARGENGRFAITRVNLRPSIAYDGERPPPAAERALHDQAHELCFIANSVTSEIVVELPPAPL